jgi:hypothetical protein
MNDTLTREQIETCLKNWDGGGCVELDPYFFRALSRMALAHLDERRRVTDAARDKIVSPSTGVKR